MTLILKKPDIAILSFISSKPCRSVEMAASLKIDKRTVHRHLTPLEKEGLVVGEYFQAKARQPVIMKKYRLTNKGKQALKNEIYTGEKIAKVRKVM